MGRNSLLRITTEMSAFLEAASRAGCLLCENDHRPEASTVGGEVQMTKESGGHEAGLTPRGGCRRFRPLRSHLDREMLDCRDFPVRLGICNRSIGTAIDPHLISAVVFLLPGFLVGPALPSTSFTGDNSPGETRH